VNVAVVQNELRNVPLADIDIAVQLGNRGSMDFSDTNSIIELGYSAAVQNQAALEKLSVSPEQWEEYLRVRRSRERTAPLSGRLVSVSSPQAGIQEDATSELLRKSGSNISRSQLEDNLSGVLAATGLPNAFYGWRRAPEGQSGYEVRLDPRRSTEILLSPYFSYQASPGEPGQPTFRLNAAAILKNAYKSRFLADLAIGDNPAVAIEYYHPFGGSAYFVAPGISLDRTDYFIYDGQDRSEHARDRFSGQFFLGMGTWRHLQLRLGARAGFDKYRSPVVTASPGGLQASNTGFVNPEIQGTINNQDSGQMPSRGFRLNGAAGWSFREHSYPYLRSNFDHFHPISDRLSLFAKGQADSSMGRKLTFYDQFYTGGLTQLDAYRYQELRADTILAAGGGVFYRSANANGVSLRPTLGVWYEAARLHSFDIDSQVRQSTTAGMFIPTPIGLVGLTFSSNLNGSTRFRFSIGSFWNRP
jgi:hypothetical protein